MDFRSFLHSERLFTENPYDQEGILFKEKLVHRPDSVIFDNFYRSKNEKIYCHICGGHRHRNGITGLLGDGSRILFGSSCAKDFFGPEVEKLCAGNLRHRTKRAYDRFLITSISNSIEPVERWMTSYRGLIIKVDIGWTDILIKYEKPVEEVLKNLTRGNGRLSESKVVSIGGGAGKTHKYEQHEILTFISSAEAITYLKRAAQRATLVDAFIAAIRSMKTQPNDQIFANLAGMYRKTLDAAEDVDRCIRFTVDFFQPDKLEIISEWMERRRSVRLGDMPEVTKQNLGPKMRKIMGFGLENPQISLSEALKSTDILTKISRRQISTQDWEKTGLLDEMG